MRAVTTDEMCLRLGVRNIALHLLNVNLPLYLVIRLSVHVDVHNVLGDRPVSELVVFVLQQPNQIESTQNGGLLHEFSTIGRTRDSLENRCSLLVISYHHNDQRPGSQRPEHLSSS